MLGLFVGHSAKMASDQCARKFLVTLLDNGVPLLAHPRQVNRNACDALEAFVSTKSALDRAYYGTALLFAMVRDAKLYVPNINNSRTVFSTRDGDTMCTTCRRPCSRRAPSQYYEHDVSATDLQRRKSSRQGRGLALRCSYAGSVDRVVKWRLAHGTTCMQVTRASQ